MTTPAPLPLGDNDGSPPADRRGDALRTWLLNAALIILLTVVWFYGILFLLVVVPDEGLGGIAAFLFIWVPMLVVPISVVLSATLLIRHRRAFFIPLIGGAVIIACAIVAFVLVRLGG